MNNSDIRRHDTAVPEGLLPPLEKNIALAIALELAIGIECKGAGISELIDLHGVIDDEIHLLQGVDLLRVAAHLLDDVAHRGEIHDRRDSREVLHQHASRPEGDLPFRLLRRCGVRECADVVGRDRLAVLKPQQVFQHDLQRKRQSGYTSNARLFRRFQREVLKLRVANLQRRLRVKCVHKGENCISLL